MSHSTKPICDFWEISVNLREKTWEILKEAISVNNRAFPWECAIGAGIAMALSIFIGIWLDQLQGAVLDN